MAKEEVRVTKKVCREVTLETNEIEDILAKALKFDGGPDFDWGVHGGCVFHVTITSETETEEDA